MITPETRIVSVGELCEKVTDGSHFTPKLLLEGYPFLTVTDMKNGHLEIEGCKRISQDDYDQLVKNGCQPQAGDVLFSKDGTVGKVMVVRETKELVLLSSIAILRPGKEILSDYLAFFLKSPNALEQAINKKSGSALKRIILKDLKTIKVPVPPLDVQREIVAVLERAEQLKEKRRKANEDTAAAISSVFIKMFGHPLKNERKWPLRTIAELGEVVSGSTPKTKNDEYWGGDIQWITPAELIDGDNYIYSDTQRKISAEGLRSIGNRLFPKDTVMLTTRAPIGKVAIAGVEMCSNQGFKNIICDQKTVHPVYLYVWLLLNKAYLNSLGTGTTFKEINKKRVEGISIPLPPLPLQQKFAEAVRLVEAVKESQRGTTGEIEQLCDAIMQKAFTEENVVA